MKLNQLVFENILSSLVSQDQRERQEYQNFVKTRTNGDWNKGAQLYAQFKKRSPTDIFGERQRLNSFVKMKFDFSKFSKQDWHNYWILVQHCDFDRKFQQNALNLIAKGVGQNSEEFKYLSDRISCALTGNQKYGTQDICKID